MKLWYSIFIWTFIVLYGSLSLAILGSGIRNTAKALRRSNRPPSRRKGLPELVLAILLTLTISTTALSADSQRTLVNLRGDQVLVPVNVPPKKDYVFQRMISVNDRLIVFLYRDPKFGRPVDYAETYNLTGELLEVAWYQPTEGLKRARDINLGNPKARGPARILQIVQDFPVLDRRPDRRPNIVGK
ncbi:MAG: hypothetical protein ACE5I9_12690 [Candidatus Methylomirabilales bacterium]